MNDSIKNKKWGGGGWEEVHSLYTANYTVSHSGPPCPKNGREIPDLIPVSHFNNFM